MEASDDHESDSGFSERKEKVEEDTQTPEENKISKAQEAITEHTALGVRSLLMSSPYFDQGIFSSRD